MNPVINKGILFLYCFFGLFLQPLNAGFVLACLGAISFSATAYYFQSRRYTFLSCMLYLVLGYFFPECLYFLPLIAYDLFFCGIWAVIAYFSLSLFMQSSHLSLLSLGLLLVGSGIAFYLQKSLLIYENLRKIYRKTRDDSTELNLLLKEKNKSLLEKQDYEIYTATLKERNRIAREIHDNVGHMLSRSILMTGAMKAINKEPSFNEPLDNLDQTLSQAMDSVRQSVHDLHDDSVNLKEAIEASIKGFTFCDIALDYDLGRHVPREIKYSFISIVKEALVNVSRHSNASHVQITLREHPGFWQLCIEDNGTTKGEIAPSGIGLENMTGRIEALHGQIEFRKTPGFRVFATVPK